MARLSARSISRSAHELLQQRPFTQVLAVFEHACDLATSSGDVIALVTLQVGDGPLNIVVDSGPGDFALLESGATAGLRGTSLHVGKVEITLGDTAVWEPCPDWQALRAQQNIIAGRLPLLSTMALGCAPAESLLSLTVERHVKPVPHETPDVSDVLAATAHRAMQALLGGWKGDLAQLEWGAAQLAGLGSGLTPAGDDFLAGAMLWAWLAHPDPGPFCRILARTAAPRTTLVSAAFLRSAAKGECAAAWHRLFAALGTGTENEITLAVRQVLAHGATSGADTLAGLLWMGYSTAA